MARDVNDVVVLGFGSWSDVYGLATLGFGIGGDLPSVPGTRLKIQGSDNPRYAILGSDNPRYAIQGE